MFSQPARILVIDLSRRRLYHQSGVKLKEKVELIPLHQNGVFLRINKPVDLADVHFITQFFHLLEIISYFICPISTQS